MTAQHHLANYNISIEEARTFILENLGNVSNIYNVCKEFGVNNDMIAEILQNDFLGLSGADVSNVFKSHGLNGDSLGFNAPEEQNIPLGGNLTLTSLDDYSSIELYQNVSQSYIDIHVSSNNDKYMYASSDTWDSIRDLGFTEYYESYFNGAVEYGSSGYRDGESHDIAQYGSNSQLAAQVGFDMSPYAGDYDLIIAYY